MKENYNLYLINTDKFKTISISLVLRCENSKEDFLYRPLLKKILLSGTKEYPMIDSFNRAKMNLYNPSISITDSVYGKDRSIVLTGSFVNDKYTEKTMNEKTIKFILDVLYRPNASNGKFDKTAFEATKHDIIEMYRSMKDVPSVYSSYRLEEEMDNPNIYTIKQVIEKLEKIDESDLYKYYETLFTKNSLDIFVIGNFDEKNMKQIITKNIKGNFIKKASNRQMPISKINEKEVIEPNNTSQSQLLMALKIPDMTEYEKKYVSIMYSSILGGGWNSKLLQEVREKNSLCYHIASNRNVGTSMIYIKAGIAARNYEKTSVLIKKQISDIQNGIISDKEIKEAKQIYINALAKIEDSQLSIMSNFISETLSNTDSIEKRKEEIKKVTKDDIIALSKKVKYDVTYLLKGVLDNG